MQIEDIILKNLIHNEEYTRKVIPFLKEDYFEYNAEKTLFKIVNQYINKYNNSPTIEAVAIELSQLDTLSQETFDACKSKIEQYVKPEKKQELAWLLDKTEEHCKEKAIHNALLKAVEITGDKTGKLSKGAIPQILQDALAVTFDNSIGHDYVEDSDLRYDEYHRKDNKVKCHLEFFNKITKGGISPKTLTVYLAATGVGKAQPLDSVVYTESGKLKFGDLAVGDKIYGSEGSLVSVIGIYPQGMKEVYKVTFEDGRSTECCNEHLWKIFDASTSKWNVMSLDEIIDKRKSKYFKERCYIPLTKPIQKTKKQLQIDPYIMGSYIGDGYSGDGGLTITNIEEDIINYWRNYIESNNLRFIQHECVRKDTTEIDNISYEIRGINQNYTEYRKRSNFIVSYLKECGLWNKRSHEKFIPEEFINSSVEDRTRLIQGLLDTDGYICEKSKAIEYSTTSEKLANQVVDIIRSLGGTSYIKKSKSFYTYKGERKQGKDSYSVRIRINRSVQIFWTKRKRDIFNQPYQYNDLKLRIKNIEYIGQKECQCIMVDSEDHLYLTDDYVVTHNTLVMCDSAAFDLVQGKNVLYITLEMGEIGDPSIAERIDANLLDITVDDLLTLPKDIFEKKINKMKEKVKGKLIIKEYATGTAGCQTFRALLNDLKIKKNFIPDIIYVDYLNLCISSKLKADSKSNSYLYIKSVTEELRALAVDFKIPVVSATQANRDGYNNSDMDLTNTSESIGLPMTVDFMLALYQDEELHSRNHILVTQLKNRFTDPKNNTRFLIGVDKPKMRLYDISDPQEGIADSNKKDIPVMDSGTYHERLVEEAKPNTKFNRKKALEGLK